MKSLPVFLDVRGRCCLVVGGGEVAARKTGLLADAGADVTVVSPEVGPTMQAHLDAGRARRAAGAFGPERLEGAALAVAATDDPAENARVAGHARRRGVPVNVVDEPGLGTFTMPSVVNRDPVQIAVSTGGSSPVLARLLRARLETMIPAAYGELAALVESFRGAVKQRYTDVRGRRRFWEGVLLGPIPEMLFAGRSEEARDALARAVAGGEAGTDTPGEVYLVGAGPGDPDLLTFRALRLLQQADVVLHDRLVSPEIVALARRDAEKIFVGKRRADHTLRQEEINALLVRLAREGKRVMRLKGGDPFVFGRGGEEIETLAAEGIAFQVVPGITAASGCAAYAGIPLTHRDHAQSCVFVTGHSRDGGAPDLAWSTLVRPQQTVVIYMGLSALGPICDRLIEHGLAPTTPMALVEQGTTRGQRVHTATVGTLPGRLAELEVHAPTLAIVGSVVLLRERLKWFRGAGEPPE